MELRDMKIYKNNKAEIIVKRKSIVLSKTIEVFSESEIPPIEVYLVDFIIKVRKQVKKYLYLKD